MYGIGFFVFLLFVFLRRFEKIFVFLIKYSTDFQKSGFNENSGHSFVFLLVPHLPFDLTRLSTAFEKVFDGIFEPNFLNFMHFLEKYPSKSAILGSLFRTGCEKLPGICD